MPIDVGNATDLESREKHDLNDVFIVSLYSLTYSNTPHPWVSTFRHLFGEKQIAFPASVGSASDPLPSQLHPGARGWAESTNGQVVHLINQEKHISKGGLQ